MKRTMLWMRLVVVWWLVGCALVARATAADPGDEVFAPANAVQLQGAR